MLKTKILSAVLAVALMSTTGSASAAFWAATNNTVGAVTAGEGNGKDQSGVMGLNGDILLGIADSPTPSNEAAILSIYNANFNPNQSLVGDGLRVESGSIVGCTVDCSYDVGQAFGIFAVKYDGLVAFFANLNNNFLAEYSLGANNFDTSNITFLTPVPAALPLLLSAIGGLFGVRWLRRRKEDEGLATT